MEKEYKILLLEREQEELEKMQTLISKGPFRVSGFIDPNEAIKMAIANPPHLILCSLELKNSDGIEYCMQIREQSSLDATIVVLMSTVSENFAQIAALNAGADDFLMKPLNGRLLQTKMLSLLRRIRTAPQMVPHKIGSLQIDRDRFLIINNGTEVPLPKKEFEILALLGSRPSKVFSRDEIKYRIWDLPQEVRNRTIDVHIRKLREKLGGHMIKTIKGVGYKLEA